MLRTLLFLLLAGLFLLAGLPATLMDAALAHYTGGGLRLAAAEGTLWQGRARLAGPDAEDVLRPWLTLDWRFERQALLRGELVWRFEEAGHPVLRLHAGPGGLSLQELHLDLPLRALTQAIPHAAARAGWQGDLRVDSPLLACNREGRCNGEARLLWTHAGVDILPERRLGDYAIDLRAVRGELDLAVSTLGGELKVDGKGRLPFRGRLAFEAQVSGDPDIVDRLPNVMGRNASRGERSGEARIHLR